jgi:hypothetical protein
MKKVLISILGVLCIVLVPSASAFAATTANVAVTATPTFIALTNSEATWAMGIVAASTSYWWTAAGTVPDPAEFEAADMKSTITNTGSVAEDIDIHTNDFAGGAGWALHATVPGENIVVLSAGITGCANEAAMLDLVDTTSQELKSDLAAAGTVKWCMLLKTGTFTDGVVKTTTVVLTASAH